MHPFDAKGANRLYPRMITPAQSRAARGLLKWTQEDLADKSGVGSLAIFKFEAGKTSPHNATLKALKDAFEKAGVSFIDRNEGVGVMLRKAFTAS